MKKTFAELELIYGTEDIETDIEIERMRAVLLEEIASLKSFEVIWEFETLMKTRAVQERDARNEAKRAAREARRGAREVRS